MKRCKLLVLLTMTVAAGALLLTPQSAARDEAPSVSSLDEALAAAAATGPPY